LKETAAEPSDTSEDNHELNGILVEIISSLDALTEELPKGTMVSLKTQIRSVLRLQLNHSLARIEALAAARAAAGMVPTGSSIEASH